MRRLAVVSNILPPSTAGTGMRLFRLFRGFRPDDYCLLTYSDRGSVDAPPSTPGRLPAHYRRLRRELRFFLPSAMTRLPILYGAGMLNLRLRAYQRARNIARVVREENCGGIMAFTGDVLNLPAGYLASLWCKVPFCAMIDDDYVNQWAEPMRRSFAAKEEPAIVKGAARVIVLNDFMQDEYRQRYGIEPAVIYNPCEMPDALNSPEVPWPLQAGEVSVVYTGSVYHAHYDAFGNLLAALKMIDSAAMNLHLYTEQSEEELAVQGIKGPVVFHGHIPAPEIPEVQARADVLFLPLAFKSDIPEVIRTSAPFKMGEYLASGRPILVHAPSDSFLSWYFRTHQCGVVVDRDDPEVLAQELKRLIADNELRKNIGMKARERALRDFSGDSVRKKFAEVLEAL